MILSCHGIQKAYSGEEILRDVSFGIEEREIVALIGINGAGKTTLLRILAGREQMNAGSLTLAKERSVGYLPQHAEATDESCTLMEKMRASRSHIYELEAELRKLEAQMKDLAPEEQSQIMDRYTELSHRFERSGGYANESEITGVLKGLGFSNDDFQKPLSQLSGGQRTRAALGALLLSGPDLLLLDEPTNHLDLAAVQWLESYLMTCQKSVLVVSHDRFFLDRIVTKVVEIERGRSITFSGNYSAYGEKKAALRREQWRAWQKQQAEIRHQEEVITKLRSYNREKSIRRAQSREKVLNKMERLERPQEVRDDMHLLFSPSVTSGRDVLEVTGLSKRYGEQVLFSGQSFRIRRGERVALIGANGTGKTTLLRILTGSAHADDGDFRLGTNVKIGYYDQEQAQFQMDHSLFEEISDAFPSLSGTSIRNMLAAFLFTGDSVFAPISTLSGGERGRLSLAKLMLSGANFLLLDEPTNHLDITSREILEDALCAYDGTVLYVSHDRYFINRTATRILELSGGAFTDFPGNYDDYLARRAAVDPLEGPVEAEAEVTAAKADWLAAKQASAEVRRRENELKDVEDRITGLEEQLASLDAELLEAGADVERCTKLASERETLESQLNELLQRWEELSSSPR